MPGPGGLHRTPIIPKDPGTHEQHAFFHSVHARVDSIDGQFVVYEPLLEPGEKCLSEVHRLPQCRRLGDRRER